jgi:hypothetical protein
MRCSWLMLVCVAYGSAAASAPWVPPVRDGTWLQNGIKQQQRWNAHETLSVEELNEATLVTSYICAVVDLEKYLVDRAGLLSSAVGGTAVSGTKKPHLDSRLLTGMKRAAPILIPLIDSKFPLDLPSCERAQVIVHDYLERYPEMLEKDAGALIEKALLDAYRSAD